MTGSPGSTPPLGMADFFALEAGEYLDRLDAVLAADGTPAADEFVRLARALRGSALMASQPAIGRAAAGLESLARALREGRRPWDVGTRQLATRAVDDLKTLVRKVATWTDGDAAKAEALANSLEQTAGRPSAQVRAAEALGLDAGARAFVAREGAAVASALDRAAQALRANPQAHDPLQQVLRALEPLRGLAALNDLPPLPDLFDGVERAIAETPRLRGERASGVADLFQQGAAAIAHAAREVAERGRPDPDGEPFRRFAHQLMHTLDEEPGVVAIESLFPAQGGPHLVRRGTPAARPGTLGHLELVSHGEHLRQAADSLERAPSATQRELRAHALVGTFRALATAAGGALADAVAGFAIAAREMVLRGLAATSAEAFSVELRRAGDVLVNASATGEPALIERLGAITRAINALAAAPSPRPPAAPADVPRRPPATDVIPVEALAPDAPAETPDLAGSWTRFERFRAAGTGPASLEEFLGGRPAVAEPTITASSATVAPATPPTEAQVVAITTLLYRGERALARARELRAAARDAAPERLRDLLDEACDLIALARDTGA